MCLNFTAFYWNDDCFFVKFSSSKPSVPEELLEVKNLFFIDQQEPAKKRQKFSQNLKSQLSLNEISIPSGMLIKMFVNLEINVTSRYQYATQQKFNFCSLPAYENNSPKISLFRVVFTCLIYMAHAVAFATIWTAKSREHLRKVLKQRSCECK